MKSINMAICERGNRGCFIFKSTSKYVKTIICVNIKNTDTNKTLLPLLVDEDFLPIDNNYTILKNCIIYKGTVDDLNIYDPLDGIKEAAESYALESCCSKIKLREQQDLPIIEVMYKYVTSIKGELYSCDVIYYSPLEMHFDEYLNYDRAGAVYKYITAILLESGISQIYIKSSEISIKENSNKYIRWVDEYKTYSEKDFKSTIRIFAREPFVLYNLDNKTKTEHL